MHGHLNVKFEEKNEFWISIAVQFWHSDKLYLRK